MVSGSYELPLMRPALLDVDVEATGSALLATWKWLVESSKQHSCGLSAITTQRPSQVPIGVSAPIDSAGGETFSLRSAMRRKKKSLCRFQSAPLSIAEPASL